MGILVQRAEHTASFSWGGYMACEQMSGGTNSDAAAQDSFGAPATVKQVLWRASDVLFSVIVLAVTAPVIALAALAIKLEDGGRVFYSQERVGLHGQPFVMLKFRSMREDAERDGVPVWAAERDSRITIVGRIIRKFRIDELPQLFNVLRGEMAVVGPRPERELFVRQFERSIPSYGLRHAVKPGITGLAQVSFRYGASLEDAERKLSYDLAYVRQRSFLLDASILLKTIGVVVTGTGAR